MQLKLGDLLSVPPGMIPNVFIVRQKLRITLLQTISILMKRFLRTALLESVLLNLMKKLFLLSWKFLLKMVATTQTLGLE
uniref:Uncharacterized protein n=1 Tax=Cannabis sativa TaxID=3483 RepID=A0A803RCN1_CANSA